MPSITLSVDPIFGPILSCTIAQPASFAAPGYTPRPAPIRLLVDTGASHTAIKPAVASKVGLPVIGRATVIAGTQHTIVNTYAADLHLPIGAPWLVYRTMRVNEMPSPNPGFDGLLGRDILMQGHFLLDGPARTFTLTL